VCLRCAQPSGAAWPWIAGGVDAFVTITDDEAAAAMRLLRGLNPPIDAGASGACGLGALMKIAPEYPNRRALIVVTEGR
jgi:diaminopropionate ammonia-lyase